MTSPAAPGRAVLRALITLSITAVVASACSATRFERSWAAPYLLPAPLRHVVAIAITKTPGRRHAMEDALATQLQGSAESLDVTPSYTMLSDEDLQSEERLRAALVGGGFDGAVMLHVTDVNRRDVYVPGRQVVMPAYYRTLWGYYGYWRPIAYEPGYIERDRDVQVETEVYVMPAGDLVYSAVSRTLNPMSASDLGEGVGQRVAKDLKDKGLIGSR